MFRKATEASKCVTGLESLQEACETPLCDQGGGGVARPTSCRLPSRRIKLPKLFELSGCWQEPQMQAMDLEGLVLA